MSLMQHKPLPCDKTACLDVKVLLLSLLEGQTQIMIIDLDLISQTEMWQIHLHAI